MQSDLAGILTELRLQAAFCGTSEFLENLDSAKPAVHQILTAHYEDALTAKAVALKLLNLLLGAHHFTHRSAHLLSHPFGLVVDPSNSCGIGCAGCVHSVNAKRGGLFDWQGGQLPADLCARYFERYGPTAIQTHFFNYGEPLLNPETPHYIRLAKRFLIRTMVSTSLSVQRFDPEEYIASGLDFVLLSIDGATPATYRRSRKNGNWDLVIGNLHRLTAARRRLGTKTPILRWQFLAFEHNAHEIQQARDLARSAGVDEFSVATPFDVTWDDPTLRAANVEPSTEAFNPECERYMAANWNPFPADLAQTAIEGAFEKPYFVPHANHTQNAPAAHTCSWLYKNMVMDAGGRVFPCCGAPTPSVPLVFADFGKPDRHGEDPFNSPRYRAAREFFATGKPPSTDPPHCIQCQWQQDSVNIDREHVRAYLHAAGNGYFDPETIQSLACW